VANVSNDSFDDRAFGHVVELRVHGVTGTVPEKMLGDPHPIQVSGDDEGRVLRARELAGSPLSPRGANDGRVVEAFHWGRFTAGSATRALWLLLLPFALLNLARFALLLPHKDADRRWTHHVSEMVLRYLGLTLTLNVVTTACYMGFDILAVRCGGNAGACKRSAPDLGWYLALPSDVKFLTAALLPVAVLLLVSLFGRANFMYPPPGPRADWSTQTGSFDDPAFWQGARNAPTQRAAHVMAGTAVLALLALTALGTPADVFDSGGWLVHSLYVVLGAASILALTTAIVSVGLEVGPRADDPDPQPRAPRRWVHVSRIVTVGVAAGSVVLVARQLLVRHPAAAPGLAMAANIESVLMALFLSVLFVLSLQARYSEAGKRLRGTDGSVPHSFRPFWGGLGGWMLAALAAVLASGFSTAWVYGLAEAIGTPAFPAADRAAETKSGRLLVDVAEGYWIGALLWAALTIAAALILLPMVCWLMGKLGYALLSFVLVLGAGGIAFWIIRNAHGRNLIDKHFWALSIPAGLVLVALLLCVLAAVSKDFAAKAAQDYAKDGEDAETVRRLTKPIARMWRVAEARYRYHHALGALVGVGAFLVIGGGIVAVLASSDQKSYLAGPAQGPVGKLGVVVVCGIASGLITLGVATWRRPALRTTVGILWDLVSFWPRLAHPLCPPPYGGRAVLGVVNRVEELRRLGATAVVLSGHSQGSVITLGATAVIEHGASGGQAVSVEQRDADPDLALLAMITYGSQLQFIYARLFPTYVGFRRLHWTYGHTLAGRWQHLYRWTDPLGGPVLSWPERSPSQTRYGPDVTEWTTMSFAPPAGCVTREPATCRGYRRSDHLPTARPYPGPPPRWEDGKDNNGVYWRWQRTGPDIRLRDPDLIKDNAHYPRSPLRGHGGYPDDPVLARVVLELAGQVPGRPGPAGQVIVLPPDLVPAQPGAPAEAVH